MSIASDSNVQKIMKRRISAWVAVTAGLLAGSGALAKDEALRNRTNRPETAKPNIIFLLADDQRNDTLGCAGHPIIKTPVIDRLAAEGVRFRNTFVTTAICAASRASIFTGLHEQTHGYNFGKPPVSAEHMQASYPMLMRQAGYRTGFIGKYGVETELDQKAVFDVVHNIGRNPYFKKQPDGSLRHETELCADRAIDFINQNQEGEPFCLSVSFNASHAEDGDKRPGIGQYPWPKTVDGMYEDVLIPQPRLNDPAIFKNLPEFLRNPRTSLNRERYFWGLDTQEKYQANMRGYFRMISGIDHAIGRIRQALDARGLADNTVIIYMADNGYYMGDRGFAGKWTHYEQSLRVPLIVYDPRLPDAKRGRTPVQMALNIDIPSTLLDLAGVSAPEQYQGRSLLPIIDANDDNVPGWRQDFFCEHLMNHKQLPKWEGVRGERYVYARYFEQKPVYEFLHDLKEDPDQLQNFAASETHKAILEEMRARCDALQEQYTVRQAANTTDQKGEVR
jgi:arylsulfatase A-like enzyme